MANAHFEFVVRGGIIVTPDHHEVANVGVWDGRIAQLGGAMTGTEELDAEGLLVIPGGIDAHVHLVCGALAEAVGRQEPQWADDFWSGSLAAIAGGITTAGNMTFALPVGLDYSISPRRPARLEIIAGWSSRSSSCSHAACSDA